MCSSKVQGIWAGCLECVVAGFMNFVQAVRAYCFLTHLNAYVAVSAVMHAPCV